MCLYLRLKVVEKTTFNFLMACRSNTLSGINLRMVWMFSDVSKLIRVIRKALLPFLK